MGKSTRAEKLAWMAEAASITDDVCSDWPWHDVDGYGRIWMDGKDRGVHVLVCALAHGPQPEGLIACHSCHRPICASGAHLRWDTYQANALDRNANGTARMGQLVTNAKLSESDVRFIRARHAAGETQVALAAEFGVSHNNIGYIVRGEAWKHLT